MRSRRQPHISDKPIPKHPSARAGLQNHPAARPTHPYALLQRAETAPGSLTRHDVLQLQRTVGNNAVGQLFAGAGRRRAVPEKEVERETGLPEQLRAGVESLSGVPLDDVKVRYDSAEPARLQALAYTQLPFIHLGPGQERYLPHEAWHAVQQKQGRVRPTEQAGGRAINSDPSLEREAEVMGTRAAEAAPPAARPEQSAHASSRRPEAGAAPAGSPASNTAQRLVGFEVELSIPTYQGGTLAHLNNGPGGAPNQHIAALLTGGLPYKTPVGNVGGIALTTDHNRLQRRGLVLYNFLAARQHAGLPLATPGNYVSISNLEYETPAFDELAAGSNAQFQTLAQTIDTHAQQIFNGQPQNNVFPIPGVPNTFGTGMPMTELQNWLGTLWTDGLLQAAIQGLRNDIQWHMTLQATAGVIPTGMEHIYRARAAATPDAARQDAINAVLQGIQGLHNDAGFKGHVAQAHTAGMQQGDYEAFMGTLHLGLSYAVGNAMYRTDILRGVDKNAVVLLAKMTNLGDITTTATTTWLRANHPNPTLIQYIGNYFHAHVPQTNVAYWTGPPHNATVLTSHQPIYGAGTNAAQDTIQMLNELLTGAGGVQIIGSGNPLPNPDTPPAAITPYVGGQMAFPVEYRWIPQHPTGPGQLWPVFQQVLNEVRAANLTHVPATVAANILAAL